MIDQHQHWKDQNAAGTGLGIISQQSFRTAGAATHAHGSSEFLGWSPVDNEGFACFILNFPSCISLFGWYPTCAHLWMFTYLNKSLPYSKRVLP